MLREFVRKASRVIPSLANQDLTPMLLGIGEWRTSAENLIRFDRSVMAYKILNKLSPERTVKANVVACRKNATYIRTP